MRKLTFAIKQDRGKKKSIQIKQPKGKRNILVYLKSWTKPAYDAYLTTA